MIEMNNQRWDDLLSAAAKDQDTSVDELLGDIIIAVNSQGGPMVVEMHDHPVLLLFSEDQSDSFNDWWKDRKDEG